MCLNSPQNDPTAMWLRSPRGSAVSAPERTGLLEAEHLEAGGRVRDWLESAVLSLPESAKQQLATQASAKSSPTGLAGREVIASKLICTDTFRRDTIPGRPMTPSVLPDQKAVCRHAVYSVHA